MSENEFLQKLLLLAGEAGIALSTSQAQLICQHVILMLEWNRTLNLTRINDPEQILSRHILDSLLPGKWCPVQGNALDVGTGAGFPGVVLKILSPDLRMTLLESQRKKASFLRVLQSQLQLQNLAVLPRRWEEILPEASKNHITPLDLITMRAVRLEAEHLTRLARQLLAPGGSFAFWAGPDGPATAARLEAAASSAGLTFQGSLCYRVPLLEHPRYLLLWKQPE